MNEFLREGRIERETTRTERGVRATDVHRRGAVELTPELKALDEFEQRQHFADTAAVNRDIDLAEARHEVHRELANFSIDTYRKALDKKIKKLEKDQEDLSDEEMKELAFLRMKQMALDKELAPSAATPYGDESHLSKRLRVEREREKIRKDTTRIQSQIGRMQEERSKLKLWNPFHWGRIRDIDAQLANLRSRNEALQMRSKLVTTSPVGAVAAALFEQPKREVRGAAALDAAAMMPLDETKDFEPQEKAWFDKEAA